MDLSDSVLAGPDPSWTLPGVRLNSQAHGSGERLQGAGRGWSGPGWPYPPSVGSHASTYEDHLMRPGRLPVLNPNAVQDDYLHLHLNRLAQEAQKAVSQDLRSIVDAYIPTQATVEVYERLDLLLCGRCQSVFHVLDEYKSHRSICRGSASHLKSGREASNEFALALTLWSNTLKRKIEQAGVPFPDQEELKQYIHSKFYRLSWKSKQQWQRMAKQIRKLSQDGEILFGSVNVRKNLLQEYHPPLWIEGENGPSMLEVKQEVTEKWPTMGVEEISHPNFPRLSVLKAVHPVAQRLEVVIPMAPAPKVAKKSVVEDLGRPMQIIAHREGEFCVLFEKKYDPLWRKEAALEAPLVQAYREALKPVLPLQKSVATEAQTQVDHAATSTDPPPATHSVGTSPMLPWPEEKEKEPPVEVEPPPEVCPDETPLESPIVPQELPPSGRGQRASRLKAMSRMRRWATDKSVASDDTASRAQTPLSEELGLGVDSPKAEEPQSTPRALLTQGNFNTVVGAFQAEFENASMGPLDPTSLSSPKKKRIISAHLGVNSPEIQAKLRKASLELTVPAVIQPLRAFPEVPPERVELIQLGVIGGASTLRQQIEREMCKKRRGRKPRKPAVPPIPAQRAKRPKRGSTSSFEEDVNEAMLALETEEDERPLISFAKRRGPKRRKHKADPNPPVAIKSKPQSHLKPSRDGSSKAKKPGSGPGHPAMATPKVLEFGSSKRDEGSLETPKNVKTIILTSEQVAETEAAVEAKANPAATSGSEKPLTSDKSGSDYVKLTYRPSQQDLVMSQSRLEAKRRSLSTDSNPSNDQQPLQQPRHSPNAFEVSSTTDNMGCTDGFDHNQEVSTTTKDGTVLTQEDTEYILDPISGLLVDKEGHPFQIKEPNPQETVHYHQLKAPQPMDMSAVVSVGDQSYMATPEVLSQSQATQVSVPIAMESHPSILYQSGQVIGAYPGGSEHSQVMGSETGSVATTLEAAIPGLPSSSFQVADDGSLIMNPPHAPMDAGPHRMPGTMSVPVVDPQSGTTQYVQTQGGVTGTSNKVLLVLPGGQMILTDLTDEQCGQLNIQVNPGDGSGAATISVPQVSHAGPGSDGSNLHFTFTSDGLNPQSTASLMHPAMASTASNGTTFLNSSEIADLPISLDQLEEGESVPVKELEHKNGEDELHHHHHHHHHHLAVEDKPSDDQIASETIVANPLRKELPPPEQNMEPSSKV